jgi:hypothetical protein
VRETGSPAIQTEPVSRRGLKHVLVGGHRKYQVSAHEYLVQAPTIARFAPGSHHPDRTGDARRGLRHLPGTRDLKYQGSGHDYLSQVPTTDRLASDTRARPAVAPLPD